MDGVHVEDDDITSVALHADTITKAPIGRQPQVRRRVHMVNVPNSVRAGNNIERSVVTVQVGGRSVAQRGDAAAACKGEVTAGK